jgi:DNA-binding NtrC family response regulator
MCNIEQTRELTHKILCNASGSRWFPMLTKAPGEPRQRGRFIFGEIVLPGGASMFASPKVLLLSSEEEERETLEKVLGEHVILRSVQDLSGLQSALEGETYDALFCGWSFQMGDWNLALKQARQQNPDLPVIILSRTGSEAEWVKVVEAGAFDLLVAPYQKRTVLPVLEHAVASYEARRFHAPGRTLTKALSPS